MAGETPFTNYPLEKELARLGLKVNKPEEGGQELGRQLENQEELQLGNNGLGAEDHKLPGEEKVRESRLSSLPEEKEEDDEAAMQEQLPLDDSGLGSDLGGPPGAAAEQQDQAGQEPASQGEGGGAGGGPTPLPCNTCTPCLPSREVVPH